MHVWPNRPPTASRLRTIRRPRERVFPRVVGLAAPFELCDSTNHGWNFRRSRPPAALQVSPRAFHNLDLVSEDSSQADRELARLRAESDEQQHEIAQLRDEAAEASSELAQLEAEAKEHRRRERAMAALIARLRSEAQVRDDAIARQLAQLAADELELRDLRAIRDALAPPGLASRPGVDLATSFLPAADGVSGDFYLVAEGPNDATALVVGDVVGKGLGAARRAAFIRTVFSTTAPFSDDPTRLLSWANTALLERSEDHLEFVTVGCVTWSPRERLLRWAYAGHPPVLWLDSGEELSGGRAIPLGVSRDWACTTAAYELSPGTGVLLYTDGVTEARHTGKVFGQTRLTQTVQTLRGQPPADVVEAVTAEVQEYATIGLGDDLCLVAARTDES
jgi:serine phosphatase RsbU (regulator of sigma subunit)